MSTSDLFCEDIDALIIERWEAAEQSVEHAAHGPHVYTLAVPFVLDDLWGGVTHGTAWCHSLLIPYNLAEAKVGNLYSPDPTATDAWKKLAFVLLILFKLLRRGYLRWDNGYTLKEQVLGLDIPVDDTTFFVEVSNSLRDLKDDMACEILAEIGEFHNLVEQFASFHDCGNNTAVSG